MRWALVLKEHDNSVAWLMPWKMGFVHQRLRVRALAGKTSGAPAELLCI